MIIPIGGTNSAFEKRQELFRAIKEAIDYLPGHQYVFLCHIIRRAFVDKRAMITNGMIAEFLVQNRQPIQFYVSRIQ